MLDGWYMYRFFDADKKQVLREMLKTQLDKMETDSVTVHTEEERPQTDRAETSLVDMCDEILFENETTEQMNNETAQQVKEIGFDYVLLAMRTYINANKITFWSVWCV